MPEMMCVLVRAAFRSTHYQRIQLPHSAYGHRQILGIPGVVEMLLWYGVLGFAEGGEDTYIHTVQYEFDLLLAKLARARKGDLYYTLNPAFWAGLEIRNLHGLR